VHGQPSALTPVILSTAAAAAYLAILKLEDQLHLVALNLLLNHFRGNPAVGRVGLPCPGAIFVNVCHVGGAVPLPLLFWWEGLVRVQEALCAATKD
jgi:hypothetical protein